MKIRAIGVAFALAVTVFGVTGESQAGRVSRGPPRTIEYAQAAVESNAVKALPGGQANMYPVGSQNSVISSMARRLDDKPPLVVQGENLLPGAVKTSAAETPGLLERFTIQGGIGYELEVELVRRGGAELTPSIRKVVQDALTEMSKKAVNIRRVNIRPEVIEIETDAGTRVFQILLDNPTRLGAPQGAETMLAEVERGAS